MAQSQKTPKYNPKTATIKALGKWLLKSSGLCVAESQHGLLHQWPYTWPKNKKEPKQGSFCIWFTEWLSLVLWLVRYGKSVASFSPARSQYSATVGAAHSFHEAMLVLTLPV
jgi:hypothetical protein